MIGCVTTSGTAAGQWRHELAEWTIPEHILARAPEPPWGFPVELFRVTDTTEVESPSRRRAEESLPEGGSVLDVGCGGGAAGLALAGRAGLLIGVDPSPDLLAEFAAAATRGGIDHQALLGSWPDDADGVPEADVVVSHHVVYNVPDLAGFARALGQHARRRVVVELSSRHPMVATRDLWRQFHDLQRPTGPSAELAAAVLTEAGIPVASEQFERPARSGPHSAVVSMIRRRLCLPADREPEVEAALNADSVMFSARDTTCLWWDTGTIMG